MRRNRKSRSRGAIAVLITGVSLLLVAAALAAKPLARKTYTGLTSGHAQNGWKPTVRFRVSSNGKQLLAFNWHGSCVPVGPPPPNVPPGWIDPSFVHPVGKINVGRNGTFSIKNARNKVSWPGGSEVTVSTVNGSFKTSKTATGTIKYTRTGYLGNGAVEGKCNGKVSFTAKTR